MVTEFSRQQGQLIIAARKKARLTQEDLAYKMGLSRTSITNMEAGRQHITSLAVYELANLCAVPVSDLFPDLYTKAEIEHINREILKENERLSELEKEIRELKQKLDYARRYAKKIFSLGEGE